jgi:ribonuclease P protein subunit RPR2
MAESVARLPNSEAFQRMNFLLQAAIVCYPHAPDLSRFYIRSLRHIAEKLVLRLDPGVKAHFCKRCSSLLTYEVKQFQGNFHSARGRKRYAVCVCPRCGCEKKTRMKET